MSGNTLVKQATAGPPPQQFQKKKKNWQALLLHIVTTTVGLRHLIYGVWIPRHDNFSTDET